MASYNRPVVFSLNGQLFGVDIELVLSIEKDLKIVSVPNSTEYVNGIINLRGEVIPSYDLRKKFGIARDENASPDELSDIVIKTKDTVLAVSVDRVLQIGDVDNSNISVMPELAKKPGEDFLERVANIDNELVILLDVDKLLSEEEVSVISEVKQVANSQAEENGA